MTRAAARTGFNVALAFALVSFAALAAMDLSLRNPASPNGIVSFELCAYSGSCRDIVAHWDPTTQLKAAMSLGVDYLFMVAYPAAICCGLLLLASSVPASLEPLTRRAAWVIWIAGAADALENYCLARMLLVPDAQQYAWPAAIFATVKFTVLGVVLAWFVYAGLRYAAFGPRRE
ncbi:MAG TPA: hypothetical protein PK163_02675 [Steroidobacteraceae bacterium]|nr:hypothetical protein [Steroidobacteraceae bacterium]